MKNFLLFILLLGCAVGAAYGQARTAASIQTAPFSQLTSILPDSEVRTCINCQANATTGYCELGSSQMHAMKLNGHWKCTKFDPGSEGGVTSITGTANMVIASASTGAVTLSLPQFIGTSNNVIFGSVSASSFLSSAGYLRFNETTAPAVSSSGQARFYMDSTSHTVKFSQHGGSYFNVVPSGLITASGLTIGTARILGRTTSSTGAIEEISIGSGLQFTGGVLSSTTSGGTVTGTGSTGTMPVWSSSTGLTDSSFTDGAFAATTKAFQAAGNITSLGTVTGSTGLLTGSTAELFFGSRSRISSPSDGNLTLTNAAGTGFTNLFFKTSSGPNIQISGVEFKFNDGGGSGGTANVTASQFTAGPTGSGNNGFTSSVVDGSVSIVAPNNSGTPYTPWTLTLPLNDGGSNECLKTDGSGNTSWGTCGTAGANTALSNLASVAINASLLAGTAGAVDVGSATKPFGFLWFAGSSGTPATNNFKLIGASTSGTRTADFPDSNTLIPIMSQRLTFTGPSASRSFAIADASTTIATAAATLTSTALVTGGGAGLVQTPSATATMDTSGNISTPGTMTTGAGGGVAGNIGLGQGTATGVVANTVQLQAPTSVTNYNLVLPTAAASGLIQWTNSANVMTGTLSALTSGRVTIATTNGLLADDSDLTFSGSTLTATNLAVTTAATVGGKTVSVTVASGTSALATGAITSGTCASAVTTSATGTATTDVIWWGFNGDPTGVTGYAPTANGMLTIIAYPSADNVNYRVCNNTASSVTPGAITLNWRVIR